MRIPRRLCAWPPWVAACLLLASPAHAADGVLEINRACATQTGCFPGDAPGFPVTITGEAGRSYRLTGDLNVSGGDTTAIVVRADDVTLDLGGFRISCFVFRPPDRIDPCSQVEGGAGLGIDAGTAEGVSVHDGSVFGMASAGVSLGGAAAVWRVRVSESFLQGIVTGPRSVVENSRVSGSGQQGIFVLSDSIVRDNAVSDNASHGVLTGDGARVSGNAAHDNGAAGIQTGAGALAAGNTVSGNGTAGIQLGSQAGYHGNVIRGVTTVVGGRDLGNNTCNGQATCP